MIQRLFIDASALVAILAAEPEQRTFVEIVESAERRYTSTISIYEATLAFARLKKVTAQQAALDVDSLLLRGEIENAAIGVQEGAEALEAHRRFGKGTGHPAQLNMGIVFPMRWRRRQRRRCCSRAMTSSIPM
jgi:ribonuclease VapC